jgi:hypothetical protein
MAEISWPGKLPLFLARRLVIPEKPLFIAMITAAVTMRAGNTLASDLREDAGSRRPFRPCHGALCGAQGL